MTPDDWATSHRKLHGTTDFNGHEVEVTIEYRYDETHRIPNHLAVTVTVAGWTGPIRLTDYEATRLADAITEKRDLTE